VTNDVTSSATNQEAQPNPWEPERKSNVVHTIIDALKWEFDDKSSSGSSSKTITSSGGRKYHIVSTLGRGAQGEVFLARQEPGSVMVALKRTDPGAPLEAELAALRAVKGKHGFNQLLEEFSVGKDRYLALGRLGPTIQDIKLKTGGKLSLRMIGSIALQMIDRMEALHDIGYVHLDFFPNNLVVGMGSEKNQLFVIDFGQARPLTASGRRFDVMSVSHSVLRLLGSRGFGSPQHIGSTRLEVVCEGLPAPVLEMFIYSHRTLARDEKPDYDKFRSIVRKLVPDYDGSLRLF
jgi:serine/threonine protein kinase